MAYWTGSIWCNLDVKEPSTKYEYHETQTWVLDGNPPINDIYNGLWTSEGRGTKTVSQVGMTLKTDWTINGSRPQNPADVVQFAIAFRQQDSKWVVQQWSSQGSLPSGLPYTDVQTVGTQSTTTPGSSTVWEFILGKLAAPKTFVSLKFIRGKLLLFKSVIIGTTSLPIPTWLFRLPTGATGTFTCRWLLIER